MHSWCLLHLLDRSPTGKVEVGRKWNIEETHGICTCLVKAAVSFHLRRSFTLSECGTCQELKMLEATGWVQHRWHRVVCVNWIRRKHSYILSKENVVIAEAVRRRGLEFSGELEGYLHRFIFQLADHFLFLRGRKKKIPLVLPRKLSSTVWQIKLSLGCPAQHKCKDQSLPQTGRRRQNVGWARPKRRVRIKCSSQNFHLGKFLWISWPFTREVYRIKQ